MKILSSVILLVLVCLSSCKEDNTAFPSLHGKWTLFETSNDPGDGSGKWTMVPAGSSHEIFFGADGKLSGTGAANFERYVVKDSTTLTFIDSGGAKQYYTYSLHNNVLTMSPAGPFFCFEGCASRYIKKQ